MLWFCQLSPPYFFASTPYELVAIASRLAPKQICTYTYLKKPNRTHNSSFLMTYLNTPPLLEFYSSSTIFPKTYNFFFWASLSQNPTFTPTTTTQLILFITKLPDNQLYHSTSLLLDLSCCVYYHTLFHYCL